MRRSNGRRSLTRMSATKSAKSVPACATRRHLRWSTQSRLAYQSSVLGIRPWLAALPERQRLAVFLRCYADLDYRTIASVLEVETGTVSATLHAAHRALREAIGGVRS